MTSMSPCATATPTAIAAPAVTTFAVPPHRRAARPWLLACAALAGCAGTPSNTGLSAAQLDAQAQVMIRASFRDEGIARVDRLNQDLGQAACSAEQPPPEAVARQIEAQALATVRWPTGGQYLGDWREGEKLAQNGRGMTWTDATAEPAANGAQCYNCHQIGPNEISHGTIGPSLYRYGKLRGVANPSDPAAAAVVQYTWAKLWNSKAYAACSNMPRFGHMKLLEETQIRHLMALLLDPTSPVNR